MDYEPDYDVGPAWTTGLAMQVYDSEIASLRELCRRTKAAL